MNKLKKYADLRFLIVFAVGLLGTNSQAFSQEFQIDFNLDGICDGCDHLVDQSTEHAFVNTCFKIGVLETQNYLFTIERLNLIGYTNIEILPVDAGGSDFENFDILYLSTGWADAYNGSYDEIESKAEDYLEYIADGGNLFVEQPNPFGQSGSTATPSILPYPITFYNFYTPNDYPPIATNPDHEITIGLDESEMAFPGDQMTSVDENYEVLVIGASTLEPSLAITDYGKGKVLICTANSNINSIYPMSDLFMSRMLDWLGKRVYCTSPIMACGSYTWIDGNTYFEDNNTATYTITDVLGCDSIVGLDLTIIENTIDATVSQTDQTLTVDTYGATSYQWLDCANGYAPIIGATEQSFTPDVNGVYAVEIIDGICTDTSACMSVMITGVSDLFIENVQVYPNPTMQKIIIDYNDILIKSVNVFSVTGQLVHQYEDLNTTFVEVEIADEAGVYLVEVSTDIGVQVHKIIKE